MATSFKTLQASDIQSSRTRLHEAIPITGTIVSGTYLVANASTNVKNFSHGMFQSVFDYPFLSSSANHIFDITVGLSANSALSASTNTQGKQKLQLYNQMAQILVGHDATGSIRTFDEDGNLSSGAKLRECYFINFARLLSKDEIQKGTFSLTLGVNPTGNTGDRIDRTITITDGANGNITATPNGTGFVEIGGNTNPGTIQLNCESNSHGIKLQSPPHSASQSYTLKFPTGNVTANTFLKVDSVTGSGTTGVGQLSFSEVSGGTSWQAVKTSGFTAAAGEGYFCNTTSAAFTATLPGSATIGDEISFIDYAGTFDTNNLTIGRNSHNIQGSAADLTVSTERAGFTLVYVDSTQGWLLKDK